MIRSRHLTSAKRLQLSGLALLMCCCTEDAGPGAFGAAAAQAVPETPQAPGAPEPPDVEPTALPWGTSARWERDRVRPGQHLCFEVLGDRFQLSVWPDGLRNPALVRGRYEVAPVHGGDPATRELRLHVETVTTKTLSRCRRSWVDQDMAFAQALGARFEVGHTVRVHATMVAPDRLRLCRARACGEMVAVSGRDLDD